ncbi:MAG: efflux RND transporter periplasmic adaptor subunit [Betaproteobacteria bacterium]
MNTGLKHQLQSRGSFFLGSLLVITMTACNKPAPPPVASAPVVEVMTVQQKDMQIQHEWVGTLDGNVNATIKPQVTGYLTKQAYREGQFVKKGQVLFEIDPRTFQSAVAQAKAARDQQQASFNNAAATLARIKPLAAKNAVSRKDLDDAIGAEQSARSTLNEATAALESANLNLGFTKILSPIDGIAGIAKAQMGDLLSPGGQTELTTVSQIDPIRAYINISEMEYLAYIKAKSEGRAQPPVLDLILADGSVYPYQGEFTVLDRQVAAGTGTFRLGALFPNKDGLLRPGLFGKVRATLGTQKDALMVPQRAVIEVQGKYLIAVVGEGNKIDLRAVKPGPRIGSDWIISEGLKSGETVVVEGVQKVRPGSVVNPQPASSGAPVTPQPASKG